MKATSVPAVISSSMMRYPPYQTSSDALRGFADAGERLTEIAGYHGGNDHESDDRQSQADVEHHHQADNADDNDELAGDVSHELAGLGLEDLRVARDAMRQLASAMPLEEWQRLGVDVGEETSPEVVGAVQHRVGGQPQQKDVGQVERGQNAERHREPRVQIDARILAEHRVDRVLHQPRDAQLGDRH